MMNDELNHSSFCIHHSSFLIGYFQRFLKLDLRKHIQLTAYRGIQDLPLIFLIMIIRQMIRHFGAIDICQLPFLAFEIIRMKVVCIISLIHLRFVGATSLFETVIHSYQKNSLETHEVSNLHSYVGHRISFTNRLCDIFIKTPGIKGM